MQRQQSASGKGGSFGGGSASKHREVGLGDFGPQERERVMELLLSQERVVALLYERTFPERPQHDGALGGLGGSFAGMGDLGAEEEQLQLDDVGS